LGARSREGNQEDGERGRGGGLEDYRETPEIGTEAGWGGEKFLEHTQHEFPYVKKKFEKKKKEGH